MNLRVYMVLIASLILWAIIGTIYHLIFGG